LTQEVWAFAHPSDQTRRFWFALLAYEKTRVDFCTTLGGVASRSPARYVVESTRVGWSGRPVHTDRSPTEWRFLHRGNDRDILQQNYGAEHEWLRVAQRVHIEQWGRIKRRRWYRQSVDPTLFKRTAVQRTVQLTKNPE
jgi:hypothetical protein